MCGIAGLLATRRDETLTVSPIEFAKAVGLMKHRGPDGQRMLIWQNESSETGNSTATPQLALGKLSEASSLAQQVPEVSGMLAHARLNIIDLSDLASQPMPYPTTGQPRFWMTFNGEIYNYRELRQDLLNLGYTFTSQSDTEVILALYQHYGVSMIERLNGMFAFAIWDVEKNEFCVARDRYGIKPLYYMMLKQSGVNSPAFAFASELKTLLALPGCNKALDHQALFEHFTFQWSLADKTLVADIQSLPAAHWGVLNLDSGQFSTQRYWQPNFEAKSQNPTEGYLKQAVLDVRSAFEQAVERQLVGDVPIGSFLSGGMDTGSITAVAARKIPNMFTFTCGFETGDLTGQESLFDERQAARDLAHLYKTRHREMTIASNAMPKVFESVVWHLDDFRAGISYQNYLVSEFVRQDVTVVLSGVGGDELFAGYPWRYQPIMEMTNSAEFSQTYYQLWTRFLNDDQKRDLFSPQFMLALGDYSTQDAFNQALARSPGDCSLHQALCFDFQNFLQALLTVEDHLSMAHSIESRVPFLDNDFVDLCLTLPAQTRLAMDADSGLLVSKAILKQAFRGLLPDEVLDRRKQGFTPPDASWYRTELRTFIESILLSESALNRSIFNPDQIRSLWQSHLDGHQNNRFLIWSLMCLEQWQRLYVDKTAVAMP